MLGGRRGSGLRESGGRAARGGVSSLLLTSPLLFGVPVALGIAISVIRLLGTAHPDLGPETAVFNDAEQLYLGHGLYHDPASGYAAGAYTPLLPALVSLLLHVHLWTGWQLLVVLGAGVSIVGLATRLAYLPTGSAPRVVRLLGAAGIGGIVYWCVTSVNFPALDEARPDQVAWAFALWGLVAVADFGPAPSRKRVVLAALLLSAALWSKQATFGIVALALAWVLALAAVSALRRGQALLFTAVLGGVNLALLLSLNLPSGGWELYLNFQLASRQWTGSRYLQWGFDGVRDSALAVAFVCVTWLASTTAATANQRDRRMRSLARTAAGRLRGLLTAEDSTGRRALLLALYVPLGYALAVYIMRKEGSDENHFVGLVWTLGLLAAVGWRVAQRRAATATVAGGCVALFFMLSQLGPVRAIATQATVIVPGLQRTISWPEIPSELRSWARDHTIYTPFHADLNVPQGTPPYPAFPVAADLLSSGIQPMYLVRALLDRHFDGVVPFANEIHEDPNLYTSSHGWWEENYIWKLEEVIAARYMAAPGLPRGVLERRPGPEPAAWMRYCFGPFPAGGASFRIRHGGGFWCSFSPNRLRLVRTPAPLSEVLSTQPVHPMGTIAVSLGGRTPAYVNLLLGGARTTAWRARVATVPGSPRELAISTYLGEASLGSVLVPATGLTGGPRAVKLNLTPAHGRPGPPLPTGTGAATLTAPEAKATFALVAAQGAEIDLGAARLGSQRARASTSYVSG